MKDVVKTIVVTGTAGFIGSEVSRLLLDAGQKVIGIDDLNDAYDIRLKKWRLAQLEGRKGFHFHRIDITDRDALRQLFVDTPGIDGVINLAARAGVRQSLTNPWVYVDTNVTGTLNLLDLCREFEIKKFVLSSTSSLYGAKNPRPFSEEANTESPLSPYAASKKGAEAMCYSYHHLYGIDVTVLRYFTVFGPAGRPDMSLFRFVQWVNEDRPVTIFGDGQQSRDFTYVEDIARGTIAALRPVGYEIINLGSDKPFILMDALHLIEELVGKKATIVYKPFHPADILATWANINKAQQLLAWQPIFSFQEGVARLVTWYQQNQEWTKDVATD